MAMAAADPHLSMGGKSQLLFWYLHNDGIFHHLVLELQDL